MHSPVHRPSNALLLGHKPTTGRNKVWNELTWNHVFVCCHFFSRYWTSMLRCSFCPSRWRAWPPRDGVSPTFSPACCMCCQVMRFVCSSPMLPCQVRTCSGDLGSVLPVWRYRERCFQATYAYLCLLMATCCGCDCSGCVFCGPCPLTTQRHWGSRPIRCEIKIDMQGWPRHWWMPIIEAACTRWLILLIKFHLRRSEPVPCRSWFCLEYVSSFLEGRQRMPAHMLHLQ